MQKEEKNRSFDKFIRICFALYVVLMLGLLYGKGLRSLSFRLNLVHDYGYRETIRRYLNTQLLRTIGPVLNLPGEYRWHSYYFRQAAGNVLMFIPHGVFLPYFRKKQRSFVSFFFCSLFMIFCIELSQLLTLLGSFDVDDILLNMCGCMIGFVIYLVFAFFALIAKKIRSCRA